MQSGTIEPATTSQKYTVKILANNRLSEYNHNAMSTYETMIYWWEEDKNFKQGHGQYKKLTSPSDMHVNYSV